MFSDCPSIHPSVRLSFHLSEAWNPSFDLYMGPLVHPTNRDRFTACPSVHPSVCPSVWRGFWAFAGERSMEGMAWNFFVICYLPIFSCDQAAIWLVQSVHLSVRPSVCPVTPFSPCSHHRIIMKFSGVITMVRSDVHAKGQGQRSKVKVTEVNTQLSRFRTLTPVWIHIWQWNHAHTWKQHRRGALLFFKVILQISRSHGSKNCRIWPRLGISGL